MSKGFCDLHSMLTKISAIIKVKARQYVNFMSNLIQHKLCAIGHGMVHIAAHSMWSRD